MELLYPRVTVHVVVPPPPVTSISSKSMRMVKSPAAGNPASDWTWIVVALAVIKMFVAYVSRAGFAPFAWYRIAAGALAIFLLSR